MLPVLLLRGRQNVIDHEQGDLAEQRARIENLWLQRPVWTAGVTLALCAAAATQLHKLYFDYNLLHMQSEGLPAVVYEKDLIALGGQVRFVRSRNRHQPATSRRARAAAYQPPSGGQRRFHHQLLE